MFSGILDLQVQEYELQFKPPRAFEYLKIQVERCQSEGRWLGLEPSSVALGVWSAIHGATTLQNSIENLPHIGKTPSDEMAKIIENLVFG